MKQPLTFFWDGQSMTPLLRFVKEARQRFAVGENYKLQPVHDRSSAAHNSYFAEIEAQWRKLEDPRFPGPEYLRHFALIECGYYYQRSEEFSGPNDAKNAARLLLDYLKFEEVLVEGRTVIVRTAQSQSRAEMGEADFKESKKLVLRYIEKMVADGRVHGEDPLQ